MKRTLRLALMLLIMCPSLGNAAALSTSAIPEGPSWVAHLDVPLFKSTAFGKQFLSELARSDSRQQLAAFEQRAGFDVLTDLTGVTAFGLNDRLPNILVLLEGDLDPVRLTRLARGRREYRAVNHAGVKLHRWTGTNPAGNEKYYGAALGKSTVAFGQSLRLMLSVLDLRSGKGPSIKGQSFLSDLRLSDSTWLVAAARVQSIKGVNPQADMFQFVETAHLAVWEHRQRVRGRLRLEADSIDSARQVHALMQGLIAISMIPRRDQPEVAELARTMSVTSSRTTVTVMMDAAPETVLAYLRKDIHKQVRRLGGSAGE